LEDRSSDFSKLNGNDSSKLRRSLAIFGPVIPSSRH